MSDVPKGRTGKQIPAGKFRSPEEVRVRPLPHFFPKNARVAVQYSTQHRACSVLTPPLARPPSSRARLLLFPRQMLRPRGVCRLHTHEGPGAPQ